LFGDSNSGDIGSYEVVGSSLKDPLYFHFDERDSFFKRMSVLDPVGDGDCGFIVLQLFGMYLEQHDADLKKDKEFHSAVINVAKMKNYLCSETRIYIDYFMENKIMMSLQRIPGMSDDSFLETLQDENTLYCHRMEFDECEKGDMFSILNGELMDDKHVVASFCQGNKNKDRSFVLLASRSNIHLLK
jgi:hypothetical protein